MQRKQSIDICGSMKNLPNTIMNNMFFNDYYIFKGVDL